MSRTLFYLLRRQDPTICPRLCGLLQLLDGSYSRHQGWILHIEVRLGSGSVRARLKGSSIAFSHILTEVERRQSGIAARRTVSLFLGQTRRKFSCTRPHEVSVLLSERIHQMIVLGALYDKR